MLDNKPIGEIPNTDRALPNPQALELWKHFSSVGGADKNTMVTVTSWLLTFSATIIGYIVTNLARPNSFAFTEPPKVFGLTLLGSAISLVALYVALLYGGYAKKNWAKADEIALANGRGDLVPDYSNRGRKESKNVKLSVVPAIAEKLADPCDPRKTMCKVFFLFAGLALSMVIAHLIFVGLSLSQILRK